MNCPENGFFLPKQGNCPFFCQLRAKKKNSHRDFFFLFSNFFNFFFDPQKSREGNDPPAHNTYHWNRLNEAVPMVPLNLASCQIEGYKHLLEASRRWLFSLKNFREAMFKFLCQKIPGRAFYSLGINHTV